MDTPRTTLEAPAPLAAAELPAARPPQLRRRDLLAGGMGLVAGAVGGLYAGGVINRKPRLWTGDRVVPEGANLSFSQFGDDLVAGNLLINIGVKKPTYLDIGAFDPVRDSNTYLFYLSGCQGVLVEPNAAITDRLKEVRPRDTVLVAGIGTDDVAAADYYMLESPGLNTFDKERAEQISRETGHKILEVVKMPLLSINRVIAEHFGGTAPDYISIDIEGLDYAVLRTLDYGKYRPKVICAETLISTNLRHNPKTTELLLANGYEVRGLTVANTIYVDRKWLA
jgi:FkbM family methyltransferase